MKKILLKTYKEKKQDTLHIKGNISSAKRSGVLNNKTPTTGRGLSKRFFGVDGPL
jgi:hypothetical protein